MINYTVNGEPETREIKSYRWQGICNRWKNVSLKGKDVSMKMIGD